MALIANGDDILVIAPLFFISKGFLYDNLTNTRKILSNQDLRFEFWFMTCVNLVNGTVGIAIAIWLYRETQWTVQPKAEVFVYLVTFALAILADFYLLFLTINLKKNIWRTLLVSLIPDLVLIPSYLVIMYPIIQGWLF